MSGRPARSRTPPSRPTLTLVKVVDNGTTGATATPADWTLAAAGPTPLSGVSGTPAVTAVPVQVGDYVLSEAGGPAGYTASDLVVRRRAGRQRHRHDRARPGRHLHDHEHRRRADADPGQAGRRTPSGGTAVPTDWLLSATGAVTIQGRVGDATVTNAVVPVGAYTLAESGGPGGYTASPWSCTGASATDPAAGTVTLAPVTRRRARSPTPTRPAKLTLAKVVDAAASGSGKVPADWTLTATPVAITGQGPVTGNGDPTSPGGVNAVTVFSGSYDLSESGPSGFTPGTWVCEGGVVTGARVVVAARRRRSLHDHQHRGLAEADAGEGRGQRDDRRDDAGDGLDAVGRRPDADQRRDRLRRGHRGDGAGRHLHPRRVRSDRLHRLGLGVHGRGHLDGHVRDAGRGAERHLHHHEHRDRRRS